MLFNSFQFFVFFLILIPVYFATPQRFRIWILLLGSYYFYMCWKWNYIFLIVGQTCINYYAGYRIGTTDSVKEKRIWLSWAVAFSLGILFFFKYYNFANESVAALFEAAGVNYLVPHLDIILPVGISFYTFQSLSYTCDVYHGNYGVETNLPRFATYVSFFPQLVAGPIERASHLLDQFRRRTHFDIDRATAGAKLILWGLFKKVVIADRLAVYVNIVYANPERYSGTTLALATVFFAFEIYCDFSGYSDMAIGSAKVLGYDIMENFRLPYFARSFSEFWRRWHISLSSWFFDYVYKPLGGNRVTVNFWIANICIVFLLSGIWHGTNWTFFMWGALHAAFYLVEKALGKMRTRFSSRLEVPGWIETPARILVTFCFVTFAWIFFRAESISDAALIASRIVTDLGGPLYPGSSQLTTALSVLLILFLAGVQVFQYKGWAPLYFSKSRFPLPVRWCAYISLVLGIALLGKSSNEFIYFQF